MDNIMDTLTIVLTMLIFFIIILAFMYWYMSYKKKNEKLKEENNSQGTGNNTNTKVATEYTKKSIFDFMQFDKIEDNMIIQDNGQKFLMIIECDGVNYDLMSSYEKTAVEAGFVQFLNTLRHPIQIYTQTRTINIENSLNNYNTRLDGIKKELERKQKEYNSLLAQEIEDEKRERTLKREIIRLKNLTEYGQDIINDTKRISKNVNVLRKHYYIVVPCYVAELGVDFTDEEEKNSMMFSELYTRAQSLINTLYACDMKCRILNSNELVELLYIAYNRDEAEVYSLDNAIKAGYSELYSTAPDVLDKKMRALDKQIKEDAMKVATQAIDDARAEKERKIRRKERKFSELVKETAEALIKENEKYVGEEVAKKAIEKVNQTEKGGKVDEQKTSKITRRPTNTK